MCFKTRFCNDIEYIKVPICNEYPFGIKFMKGCYMRVPVTDEYPFGVRYNGEQQMFTGDITTCPFVSGKSFE